MSGELDWLDYAQKLGPSFGAIATTLAVVVALSVASRNSRQLQKEQPNKITAWLNGEEPADTDSGGGENGSKLSVKISNASQQTAYDVIVRLVRVPNRPNQSAIPVLTERDIVDTKYILALPPGDRIVLMAQPSSGMHRRFGVEFALQDAAGAYWYRNSVGMLSKISKHPVEFFGLSWPMGWGS